MGRAALDDPRDPGRETVGPGGLDQARPRQAVAALGDRAAAGVSIGRKNWLFAGADAGGETLADAMTLIETAKLAGLDPEAYLADVLARINDHLITRLDELLPWNWTPLVPEPAQAA